MALQLTYNGVALHNLGLVVLTGQSFEPSPDATTPEQLRSVLGVKLVFTAATFTANRALAEQALTALRTPLATLVWAEGGTTFLSREVTARLVQWPDTGYGQQRIQEAILEFAWPETISASYAMGASFTGVNDEEPVDIGIATKFSEQYAAQHYNPLLPQRSGSQNRVSLSGRSYMSQATAATRQAALMTLRDTLLTSLTAGSTGTLVCGTFNRSVRLEEFRCEFDSAGHFLTWTLTASYTRWPDEDGYVLAEFDIQEREEVSSGTLQVTLSGRILAATSAAAITRLGALRTSLSARYSGKTLTRQGSPEQRERAVQADTDTPDGTSTFVELTFSETYTVTAGATVLHYRLNVSAQEDPASGTVQHSYRGSVEGTASTWSAAYQAAYQYALTLGANKHAVLTSGRVSAEDQQQASGYAGSGTSRFCRVEFEFTYRLRGSRVWIELTGALERASFGHDTETVSGTVLAPTMAAARALYDTLRAGYQNYLIESERIEEQRQRTSLVGGAPTGTTLTPPLSTGFGATLNGGEETDGTAETAGALITPPTLGASYVRQFTGLRFTLTILRAKPTTRVAVRYETTTEADYVNLVVRTSLRGRVAAADKTTALAVVTLITPAGVTLLQTRMVEEYGKLYYDWANPSDDVPSSAQLISFTFERSWSAPLTGDNALVELSVEDAFQHSGPNWVTQPTAFGRPVVQMCGYTPAKRRWSASATSVSEAAAMAWVKAQWKLLLSSALDGATALNAAAVSGSSTYRWVRRDTEGNVLGYLSAPRMSTRAVWLPRSTSPVARGTGANPQLWRVTMEAEEILPTADATPEAW